ncbi:HEAT repeat domain-containing protein [Haladaptatus sp.]|uniref:HEAT repeat domain-containing protein n=1 Tax=Haladaptatus sp. TaxID=1973141 RepID=UPI003C5CB13A
MTGDHDQLMELDPETVSADDVEIDTLREGLRSEENLVRTHTAQIVSALAADDLETVEPLIPTLVAVLDDDRIVVLRESLLILAAVADDTPSAVRDAIPDLLSLLTHETPLIPALAADVIRVLAIDHPEWFVPYADELVAVMETEPTDPVEDATAAPNTQAREHLASVSREEMERQTTARTVVANVVYEVASIDAEAVRPHASRLCSLVCDGSGAVLSASVGAISFISEEYPDAVADAVAPLCDRLTTPDRTVQVHAVSALGHIGDPSAADPLREFADGDAPLDEEIRSIAHATEDWLIDESSAE